ncbi:helix-turn-helix domain-containing protein [Azomonas agilis]|uniref:helix-turn-helix domain-containing protein n=1 Tax=Azomonas agilis TaxID=116849 RepID=UPI003CCC80FD
MAQAQLLAQTFGCTRFVYNHILHWRRMPFIRGRRRSGICTPIRNSPESSALVSFRG